MPATMPVVLPLAQARRVSRRVGTPQDRVELTELALLVGAGAGAAALSFSLGGWGIPGSNIVQAVLPMAAGLALVPRRGAGLLMGTSSVAANLLLGTLGYGHATPSTFSSLFLLGACLEFAANRTARSRRIWLWFVLAGLVANLLAFGLKMASAQLGWEGWGGARGLFKPWPARAASFALCGAVAGGASAVIFFRRHPPSHADSRAPRE